MKKLGALFLISFFLFLSPQKTYAQDFLNAFPSAIESISTNSATASESAKEAEELARIRQQDVTRPEGPEDDQAILLFKQRPADQLSITNIMAFLVQSSVKSGVPSRTIILILLLPMLATIIAFIRHVIGLPSIGMLVPVALSITLLSTGITAGLILLATIIFGSTVARILLKKLRIMQLPKMAFSMFIVSIFLFLVLTVSAMGGILAVKQLSIFPILLLILLSEQIISVQQERSAQEMIIISMVTFAIGILGFLLLSSTYIRNTVLLYPEFTLLLIPINIIVGRYFGLRLMEYFRFSSIMRHASK